MAGTDKSTQRVIIVVALLVVAVWALRGYVPGIEPVTERPRPPESPAALVAVVAMLTASVAIIAFAIVVRLRDRSNRRKPAGALPTGSGAVGKPTWRFSLVVLAALIGWLLLVALLSRFGGMHPPGQPAEVPPASPEAGTSQQPTTQPPPAPVPPESDTDVVDYLIPPMLVLMAVIVIGTAVAARRQRAGAPQRADFTADDLTPTPRTAANPLVRAAEVGLAEIGDLSREPREAIIACYAAMERELTRVPGAMPQDCDTPSEVLARAVHRGALRADSATELVELFEEARFSPHVMTEVHRDAAVRVLRRVLAELPAPVSEVTT